MTRETAHPRWSGAAFASSDAEVAPQPALQMIDGLADERLAGIERMRRRCESAGLDHSLEDPHFQQSIVFHCEVQERSLAD